MIANSNDMRRIITAQRLLVLVKYPLLYAEFHEGNTNLSGISQMLSLCPASSVLFESFVKKKKICLHLNSFSQTQAFGQFGNM